MIFPFVEQQRRQSRQFARFRAAPEWVSQTYGTSHQINGVTQEWLRELIADYMLQLRQNSGER